MTLTRYILANTLALALCASAFAVPVQACGETSLLYLATNAKLDYAQAPKILEGIERGLAEFREYANSRPSVLDGLRVPAGTPERIINVMVENQSASRPGHAGLSQASIVWETLVEGGITRFMLQFSRDYPERVGPVRSARPYFVDWAEEHESLYVHAGGSDLALSQLYSSPTLQDVDESTTGLFRDKTYFRPHNLFANLQTLSANFTLPNQSESYFHFCEKDTCYPAATVVNKIQIYFSNESSYDVSFQYDAASQTYLRNLAGTPHLDQNTGKQIAPKNLVIIYLPYTATGDEKGHILMQTSGSGQAQFFSQGKTLSGTWRKLDETTPTIFRTETGVWNPTPGQTWIMVVSDPTLVNES